MFRNYLTVAIRNLLRNKAYSSINLIGLAIGLACCLLIALYVRDELNFDGFHANADRIYRVTETRTAAGQPERHFPFTMGPVGPSMVESFPEVVKSVRIRDRSEFGRFTVSFGSNKFYEGNFLIAEPSFFEIFTFKLLRGNPTTALAKPQCVVLTTSAAEKYFGTENPLGKTMLFERWGETEVTGLMVDPPKNSHLDFNMIISFATLESNPNFKRYIESWNSDTFITYIQTQTRISPSMLEGKLAALVDDKRGNRTDEQRVLGLQPLSDIHFKSGALEFDHNARKGEIWYVYIFSGIAILVLAIACINYMNLATARSLKRAKEVGMRKVVGAFRQQLVGQFLGESILLALLALVLAVALAQFALPSFNSLADKNLTLAFTDEPLLLVGMLAMVLTVGVVAGSYPSFYLARLRPVTVFKGETAPGDQAGSFRRVLVVAQFTLSIIMMAATVVAFQQLNYLRDKNLGFKQDQLVVIDINSRAARTSFEAIKTEFASIPAVQSVSVTSRVPGEWKNLHQVEVIPPGSPETARTTMHFLGIDADFLSTFEVALANGRNLDASMGLDTAAVLINETAARLLGSLPLDQVLRLPIGEPEKIFEARIVGVVKDFHFQSLHEEIGPLVLGHWNNPVAAIDYFTCRVRTENLSSTLAALQRVHERFDQVTPFEYNFLDAKLQEFYVRDQRTGDIFGAAAFLAILVACLGLLGLAAFAAEQRRREIGIRKVLGASVKGIILLLSKEFVMLIAAAFLVAGPVAYFAMSKWLENFAYHVEIGFTSLLFAGLAALLLGWLTICAQTLRAAYANPVDSLRYE